VAVHKPEHEAGADDSNERSLSHDAPFAAEAPSSLSNEAVASLRRRLAVAEAGLAALQAEGKRQQDRSEQLDPSKEQLSTAEAQQVTTTNIQREASETDARLAALVEAQAAVSNSGPKLAFTSFGVADLVYFTPWKKSDSFVGLHYKAAIKFNFTSPDSTARIRRKLGNSRCFVGRIVRVTKRTAVSGQNPFNIPIDAIYNELEVELYMPPEPELAATSLSATVDG
jgi:hypothetical protein